MSMWPLSSWSLRSQRSLRWGLYGWLVLLLLIGYWMASLYKQGQEEKQIVFELTELGATVEAEREYGFLFYMLGLDTAKTDFYYVSLFDSETFSETDLARLVKLTEKLPAPVDLGIGGCSQIEDLSELRQLKNLIGLTVSRSETLTSLDGLLIPGKSYDSLVFDHCPNLTDISALKENRIQYLLSLEGNENFNDISVLIYHPQVLENAALLYLKETPIPQSQIDQLQKQHSELSIKLK
ncbi:MAG: hypothetical protein KDA65_19330 [Planctomycetaceae bacterium]|nr:hypothetical protein [Planctomycetaceae bacterium]